MTYSNPFVVQVWGWLLHLANFALPALVLASLLAPAVAGRHGRPARALWRAWCWLAASGLAVLTAGLVLLGRDGKMATYAALVLVIGSLCFWLQWRHPQGLAAARTSARRPPRR